MTKQGGINLDERECVLLSALLHDIGKVFQRTGLPPDGYEDFTPEDVGKHGAHAKWTGSFFSKYVPEHFREAGHYALYPHKPQTPLQQYVSTADRISAGESVEGEETEPKKERLAPVANHVFLEQAIHDTEYRYPLKALSLEREDLMPKPKADEVFKGELTEEYKTLWTAFTTEIEQLNGQRRAEETSALPGQRKADETSAVPGQDFEAYFFTLYFLLKKYFLRVPSAPWGSSPDISLFDHARVTAALADCLYVYYQEKKGKEISPHPPLQKGEEGASPLQEGREELLPLQRDGEGVSSLKEGGEGTLPLTKEGEGFYSLQKGEEQEFLLIEGDISGIQKFIFNMVSPQQERARLTKRLRGRSCYLLLLTETLADYVLKRLDLKVVHQLWCTGGHFLIIAPNTPTMTYHLKASYKDINEFLIKTFRGELGFVLSWEAASGENLENNFYGVRRRLTEKTEREKRRKLHNVLENEKNLCFPSEPPKPKKEVSYAAPGDRFVQLLNDEHEEIGTILARFDKQDRRKKSDKWLAKVYSPVSKAQERNLLATFRIAADYQVAWIVNPEDPSAADALYLLNGVKEFWKYPSTKSGFTFFVTYVDTYSEKEAKQHNQNLEKHNNDDSSERVGEGDIKDFEDLAKSGKGGFLGVLRMDVDHLGAVFSIGIPRERQSISRIASLSSDIELFFTGYFQHLCKKEFEKNTYVAYSGGDDLFVVGAWDTVLDLACKVREDFKTFTCQNKDINISGGLFLCKGKYPIHRAAERAEHLLNDLAKENQACEKNLQEKITHRNALAIFNHRMPWEEFLALKETGEEFVAAIQRETLNRTYVYKLLDLHNTWKTNRQLNIARLYYITVRNIKNVQFSQQMIAKHQYLSNQSYMPILVGYTALKTRKEK